MNAELFVTVSWVPRGRDPQPFGRVTFGIGYLPSPEGQRDPGHDIADTFAIVFAPHLTERVVRSCPELILVVEEYFAGGGARAERWRDRFVDRVDGLRVIGTDEREWLSGAAAFAVFADPTAHVDPRPTIVLEDLEAYEHGGAGWVACRPLLSLPDGTTLTLRWTGVFERMEESWKLRQLHVSKAGLRVPVVDRE